MAVSVDTNSDTVTISTNGFAFKKATDMVTDQINYITPPTYLVSWSNLCSHNFSFSSSVYRLFL